jgi:tetratricopeptide (TPR) repeat protein
LDRYRILDTLSELFPLEIWLFQVVKLSCQANYPCKREEKYNEGFTNYNSTVQIWLDNVNNTELNCYIDIGQIHNTIAWYYKFNTKLKDQSMAMKHTDLSIMYFQLAIENTVMDDYELIHIYEKLSDIFRYKMKITDDVNDGLMAIKYGELRLQSLILYYSDNDIKVGRCLDDLADIYKSTSNYDAALLNYDRSLKKFIYYKKLKLIFMKIHRYDLAMNNFRTAIRLYENNDSHYDDPRLSAIKKKLNKTEKYRSGYK